MTQASQALHHLWHDRVPSLLSMTVILFLRYYNLVNEKLLAWLVCILSIINPSTTLAYPERMQTQNNFLRSLPRVSMVTSLLPHFSRARNASSKKPAAEGIPLQDLSAAAITSDHEIQQTSSRSAKARLAIIARKIDEAHVKRPADLVWRLRCLEMQARREGKVVRAIERESSQEGAREE